MTRRRWIADEASGDRAALIGEHADHLVRVLRARVGDDFDIATSRDVRRGRITLVKADRVEFDLGEILSAAGVTDITLVLAVYKFDRMEWAIEKCTELGVSRIVPLISRRTDSHLAVPRLESELSVGNASRGKRRNNPAGVPRQKSWSLQSFPRR